MRSPDNDSRRNYPNEFLTATSTDIPDVEGAPTGLSGIKAPFGRNQHDDITDRARAMGHMRPGAQLKR
jgi:hypothetical protein